MIHIKINQNDGDVLLKGGYGIDKYGIDLCRVNDWNIGYQKQGTPYGLVWKVNAVLEGRYFPQNMMGCIERTSRVVFEVLLLGDEVLIVRDMNDGTDRRLNNAMSITNAAEPFCKVMSPFLVHEDPMVRGLPMRSRRLLYIDSIGHMDELVFTCNFDFVDFIRLKPMEKFL